MVQKFPLVFDTDLKIQQLQSGDFIAVGSDQITATFTSTAIAGALIYADGNDTVDLAQADAEGTSRVKGLAVAPVTMATSGQYVHDGPLTLTTGEWDAVFGTTGGLTVDLCYFLDDTAAGLGLPEGGTGTLGVGDFRVVVGTAISTTTLLIKVKEAILL